jgi:hypothetical protein
MTEALEKEVAEMEAAEVAEAQQEQPQEVDNEVAQDSGNEEVLQAEEVKEEADTVVEAQEEVSEEEAERKRQEYHERVKARQQKREQEVAQPVAKTPALEKSEIQDDNKQLLEELMREKQQRDLENRISAAGNELKVLENDFKTAYTDYDDIVNDALELSKIRLMSQGMSEGNAISTLEREKILLADSAASKNLDPVEAVYNEAKEILSVFDKFAEMKGYKKVDGAPKTNLQAIREINKPNAMSGGAGKGAAAANPSFDEMEDLNDINNMTIGDLLNENR